MTTSISRVLNTNLTLQYTVNFYNWNIHKTKVHLHKTLHNWNIHKTKVHLHKTLHTNASRDQNAVADSEINQILNLQNLNTKK